MVAGAACGVQKLVACSDPADLQRDRIHAPHGSERSEHLDEVLLFEIETYSGGKARELVENQPDTFRYDERANRERSLDERIALILRHVRLLIVEQLQFEVSTPAAGRIVRFIEDAR